jgi:hypothetical protein
VTTFPLDFNPVAFRRGRRVIGVELVISFCSSSSILHVLLDFVDLLFSVLDSSSFLFLEIEELGSKSDKEESGVNFFLVSLINNFYM